MITTKLLKLPILTEKLLLPSTFAINHVRNGHRMRGKAPGVAKSLEQRFEMMNAVDPEISKLIDIGFPALRPSRAEELKIKNEHFTAARNDKNLEKLSRNQQLTVDLEKVRSDWRKLDGQFHIKNIATHHGIYEHLFGYAYFLPRVPLDIKFKVSEDEYAPVYYGNLLKPTNAKEAPEVTFDPNIQLTDAKPDPNTKWTLVLTNPDGHLKNSEKEYVHWFIGNIPGNDLFKADIIVPYLQPIPAKGTGYHRHVFILYKQEKPIDFSEFKCNNPADLDQRTFSTLDFYRKFQDVLTPAGLSFFQADWDTNLTDFYHNVLNMKEPVFEYDFPKAYLREEKWFALRQAFNLYLDRYRDPQDINKDFVVRRLKATDPFDGPEPPLRYPNAQQLEGIAQWRITEEKKYRLLEGRVNEVLYPEDDRIDTDAAREQFSKRRRFRTEHARNPITPH